MQPFSLFDGRRDSRVVITCEHASSHIPSEYGGLGVDPDDVADHIGWDIGAGDVARVIAGTLGAPVVLSGVSRLVIDCNRAVDEHDLIVAASDGVLVPGNQSIDVDERERRISHFYRPYHDAVDEVLFRHAGSLLLSIHSFTPALRVTNGAVARGFDIGVLFDDHAQPAERLGQALEGIGLRVRYNEPYSALSGLIFSARSHGSRHGRPYLELEINNRLLRTAPSIESVGSRVAAALQRFLEEECVSS